LTPGNLGKRKERTLKWLIRALSSSIGKKYVMSVTGLLLCGFLIIHLAGNLLLFESEQAYNDYAHALHEIPAFVRAGEAVLIVLFSLHLFLAFSTARDNRLAREVEYEKKVTKQDARALARPLWPDKWMLVSGLVILGFLLLHLADFTFQVRTDIEYPPDEPYQKARNILLNPVSAVVYVAGSIFLMAHLWHGVGSAFHTLGISHPKYSPVLWVGGIIFALVMGIGYASFVVWAWTTSY
jgi:succinate dehydrogenase / fumarate reductase, cytochrome b subunit